MAPTYDVTITVPGASAPVTILSETNCTAVQDIPKGTTVWEIDYAPGMVIKVTPGNCSTPGLILDAVRGRRGVRGPVLSTASAASRGSRCATSCAERP